MTTAQLIIACATVLLLALIAAGTLLGAPGSQDAGAPPRVGHRVTVHTKSPDDQTIFGVLVADYTDRLSLEHAELVSATGRGALPGRQDIATADVSWIDVHALVAEEG